MVSRSEASRQHSQHPRTPPLIAQVPVVEMLLQRPGADCNKAAAKGGRTPLHAAAHEGHADVVRLLLRDPRIEVCVWSCCCEHVVAGW